MISLNATSRTPSSELVKGLRLYDCTTIVMGSMIGSGIFIVAAEIAREVRSPGLFLLCWVVSGVMTVAAAVTYGELAGMMPTAGGQYVYLREAFGPLFGFLYGWTLFLVIQTGTLAAVAVAFGKFLGVLVPWVSTQNLLIDLGRIEVFHHSVALTLSSQQLVAILSLLFLSVLNIFGLRLGAWVQNIFTTLKVAALLGLVAFGFWWSHYHPAAHVQEQSMWGGVHWNLATLTVLSVALVGPLFSSDAWNNVTFTGSEIVNPKRNLPLALFVGTAHRVRSVRGVQLDLSPRPAILWKSTGFGTVRTWHPIRCGRQGCDRGGTGHAGRQRRGFDGCGNHDFNLRLHEWNDPGGSPGLLRHGEGWPVLSCRGQSGPQTSHPGNFPRRASRVGCAVDLDRDLQRIVGIRGLRSGIVLCSDYRRGFPAEADTSRSAQALPGLGLSSVAGNLYLPLPCLWSGRCSRTKLDAALPGLVLLPLGCRFFSFGARRAVTSDK